ncbi:MAG: DNA-directed RNA polymerase subunit omega [Clostridiaceae bacterium]|nr:DNA-directed RNA polymerase subunit omega [Oscillospiraceae bacterium]NLO62334.1 DNA-directed RNA polymerase subunit omega [Clostridiaceae bacterium]
MLVQPPIEELLPKAESRYSLAMLVAKRTRQLVDGAQPMVPETTTNLVTLACEEIVAGMVVGIPGLYTPIIPLRPEIEEARRLARELAENQASLEAFPDLIDMKILNAKSDEVASDGEEASSETDVADPEEATGEETDADYDSVAEGELDVSDEEVKDLIALDGAETEDAD